MARSGGIIASAPCGDPAVAYTPPKPQLVTTCTRSAPSFITATIQARAADIVPPPPTPAVRTAPRRASEPALCRVLMASYGGTKTMLIRHVAGDAVEYTALRVLDGFERSMTESYMTAHAPGGSVIGEYPSTDDAFARAYELCPGADRGR